MSNRPEWQLTDLQSKKKIIFREKLHWEFYHKLFVDDAIILDIDEETRQLYSSKIRDFFFHLFKLRFAQLIVHGHYSLCQEILDWSDISSRNKLYNANFRLRSMVDFFVHSNMTIDQKYDLFLVCPRHIVSNAIELRTLAAEKYSEFYRNLKIIVF